MVIFQCLVSSFNNHIYIIQSISRALPPLTKVTYILIYNNQYLIRIIHPLWQTNQCMFFSPTPTAELCELAVIQTAKRGPCWEKLLPGLTFSSLFYATESQQELPTALCNGVFFTSEVSCSLLYFYIASFLFSVNCAAILSSNNKEIPLSVETILV